MCRLVESAVMDDVEAGFPSLGDLEFIGPFEQHSVLLYGREVPYLDGAPADGGRVHLMLDKRYGLELTVEEAERVVPFIADCIAVAAGYACHPRRDQEPCRLPLFAKSFSVGPMMTD
jgi:hypothetical protein